MVDFKEIDNLIEEVEGPLKTWGQKKLEIEKEQVYRAVLCGQVLQEERKIREEKYRKCNHRKGGRAEFIQGKGYTGRVGLGSSANDYAVLKHTMPWGDMWIRCLRCGHWWKPGDIGYEEAAKFPTTNSSSSGIVFKLSQDRIDHAREITRGTH